MLLRSPPVGGRLPMLRARLPEAAGKATADCAAVCCCCPCLVADFLVLAVYRFPAGLCRRARRQRRQRRILKQAKGGKCTCGCEVEESIKIGDVIMEEEMLEMKLEESPEMEELEEEMWKAFYGTGFWRSPSQKE
ncbi:hypothetical protein SAY87_024114 [Trapa incisa]|uniref:Uncharacterized protein n=1 Tax=Trapa incisa TaxID=236973 RepID=A0AAN7L4L5_9MYRT|nr:hypothetical protein SAY87_024114 [Trapa incisa]